MTIGERIRYIRENLNLSQEEFGKKINVTRSAVSNYEKGLRNIMDRVIMDICREFNVHEEWLRNNTGDTFVKEDTFSIDDYLKQKGAKDIEVNIVKSIVKGYFGVSEELRDEFIDGFIKEFKKSVNKDDGSTITKEIDINSIDSEVEAYRSELVAEKIGLTYSVSGDLEEGSDDKNLA